MAVTCYYSGRFGNCVFSAAMLLAYAKKYDLSYYLPDEAVAYRHFRNGDVSVPFVIKSTGEKPTKPKSYHEPENANGNPYYHVIPKMDNVKFWGYWQSFRWFEGYRDYIIEKFNFPYKENVGMTSISVRRGDCINSPNFPIAPKEYYVNAIKFMQDNGFNKFLVNSEDIEWCKKHFNNDTFKDAEFEFTEGKSEMEIYLSIQNCTNQIVARSTFSLTAAWMNRNKNKIVCVPTLKHQWWRSQNVDLLTGTNFYQIDFEKPTDEWSV